MKRGRSELTVPSAVNYLFGRRKDIAGLLEHFRLQVHKSVSERDAKLWREGICPDVPEDKVVLNDGERVHKVVSYGQPPRPHLCHAMVCEVVIQRLVYEWWRTRSLTSANSPVFHPFPCFFKPSDDGPVVVARQTVAGDEIVQFAMFAFDQIRFEKATSVRMVQIVLQVAATLRYFQKCGVEFMHMDLHFENVMERRTHSRATKGGVLSLTSNLDLAEGRIGKSGRAEDAALGVECGAEVNIIDFGYSWLKLPDQHLIFAGERNSVYRGYDVRFNSQQDLRILMVTYWAALCVDRKSFTVSERVRTPFSERVHCVISAAREGSPRFRLSTDLVFIQSMSVRLLKFTLRGSTLDEAIERCAESLGENDMAVAFVRSHRNVWDNWLKTKKFPPLQHFQYQWGIHTYDTPIFEPLNLIRYFAKKTDLVKIV